MSSVVGVDFGYQNSVIAAAGRGGVDVILNGNSNRLNPYVQYREDVCAHVTADEYSHADALSFSLYTVPSWALTTVVKWVKWL